MPRRNRRGSVAGFANSSSQRTSLARGLPDDQVVLLTHSEVLRVMPDLVYVPTDARLVFSEDLRMDESILTGESILVPKDAHILHAPGEEVPNYLPTRDE